MHTSTINHQAMLCEATYSTRGSPILCYDPEVKNIVYKSSKELDEKPPIYFQDLINVSIEEFHQVENPRSIYYLFFHSILENRCDIITYIVKQVGSSFFEHCPEYEPTLLMRAMDHSKECNKYAPFNCLLTSGAKVNCAAKIPVGHIVGKNNPNIAYCDSRWVAICTPLWVAVNVTYAEKDQIYMAARLLRKRAVCLPENTPQGEIVLQQAKKFAITANELLFLLGSIYDNKSLFFKEKDVTWLVLNTSLDLEQEIPNIL